MRSISAWAPAQILKPGKCAFRFIGRAERRLEKPECISPLIDRQWARATRSVGSSPALGFSRSEEHTSELQSLMRISYAVFCLKNKTKHEQNKTTRSHQNTHTSNALR